MVSKEIAALQEKGASEIKKASLELLGMKQNPSITTLQLLYKSETPHSSL